MPTKKAFFPSSFVVYYLLQIHSHHSSKIPVSSYFSLYFGLLMEGSRSGSVQIIMDPELEDSKIVKFSLFSTHAGWGVNRELLQYD
jgi:hypothetical protein